MLLSSRPVSSFSVALALILVGGGCRCGARQAPSVSVAPEVACRSVFQALTESAKRCTPLASDELFQELTDSTCKEMVKSISAGRMRYDSSQMAACTEALKGMPCEQRNVPPASCAALFAGNVSSGGSCYNSDECQGSDTLYCRTAEACPGSCVPYVATGQACKPEDKCAQMGDCVEGICLAPGQVGDSCGSGTRRCTAGLYCDSSGGSSTCTKKKLLNEECTDSDACSGALTCVGLDFLTEQKGHCQKPAVEGAPCGGVIDCEWGLVCKTSSENPDAPGKCTRPKKVGEACKFGEIECSRPNVCDPETAKCVGPSQLGQPCGFAEKDTRIEIRSCKEGYCHQETRVCTAYKAAGAECETGDSGCEFGCGEDGKCQRPLSRECKAP